MANKDLNQEQHNILRKIEKKPESSQREMASELNISLGKLNYCLKELKKKGLIKIRNLNNTKRPISAVADNVEVRNIKSVKIRVNNHVKFKLLYDKKNSLAKKIKLEQARKETK